jgi:hypothetical protein
LPVVACRCASTFMGRLNAGHRLRHLACSDARYGNGPALHYPPPKASSRPNECEDCQRGGGLAQPWAAAASLRISSHHLISTRKAPRDDIKTIRFADSGFRYRLLDKSQRLSVDIDNHWGGDLEAKQRELLALCRRVSLGQVLRELEPPRPNRRTKWQDAASATVDPLIAVLQIRDFLRQ